MGAFMNFPRGIPSNFIDSSSPTGSSSSSNASESGYSTALFRPTGTVHRSTSREDVTTRLLGEYSDVATERPSLGVANRSYGTTRLCAQLQETTNTTEFHRDAIRRREEQQRRFHDLIGRHPRDLGLNGLPRELVDGLVEYLETTQRRSNSQIPNAQRPCNAPPPTYSCVDTFVAQMVANRTLEETLAALTALEMDDETNRGKLPEYSSVDPLTILPLYQEATRGKFQKWTGNCDLWKGINLGIKRAVKALCSGVET